MDEVDGMAGNEDRGGMQELIQLIKSSHIPIICICNDRQSQKIRSLANHCFDLRFQRPRVEQIKVWHHHCMQYKDIPVLFIMGDRDMLLSCLAHMITYWFSFVSIHLSSNLSIALYHQFAHSQLTHCIDMVANFFYLPIYLRFYSRHVHLRFSECHEDSLYERRCKYRRQLSG